MRLFIPILAISIFSLSSEARAEKEVPPLEQEEKPLTLKESKDFYITEDKKLNSLYARAKKELSSDFFAYIQKEQRQWLIIRDSQVNSDISELLGLSWDELEKQKLTEMPIYWSIMATLTQERCSTLETFLNPETNFEWQGYYEGNNGMLSIQVKKNGEFEFSISSCSADTGGTATTNGEVARYSSNDDKEVEWQSDDPLWLDFKILPDGKRIEVKGVNSRSYCGGSFDGVFYRVGPYRPLF